MSKRRTDQPSIRRYRLALMAAAISVSGMTLVGTVGTGTAAAAQAAPVSGCAAQPGTPGCVLSGISVGTSALVACDSSCQGVELPVGETVDLPIDGTYSDGSSGPLSVLAGPTAPAATLSVEPQPAGGVTLTGVVNGAGADDEAQVTASAPTTSPLVVQVTYGELAASTPPLNAVDQPSCGGADLPVCSVVNGALLYVQADVLTGTASDLTGTASDGAPLAGAVADISQAGSAAGATTSELLCYPQGTGASQTCGAAPSGSPAVASPATCTTDSTGACPLAAMWDGTAEAFAGPDVVSMFPPAGYVVTGVSGCSSSGTVPGSICDISPADWSQPLAITFDLAPDPVVTVDVAGPLEPCRPPGCAAGQSQPYDNDAVDLTTVTVTPTGPSEGSPLVCQVAGGVAGVAGSGQPASCSVSVTPGTYTVSLPASISTPGSEVGIPFAYPTGAGAQTVVVAAGGPTAVDFTTGYEPVLTVTVAGPAEPCDPLYCAQAGDTVYDNDAIDGAVVSVTPSGSTAGPAASCSLGNGQAGDASYGVDAYCTVDLPPGTYSVSLPSTISTPNSEVGISLAYVTGADPQPITLSAGGSSDLEFSTAYQPTVTVQIAGPLEPPCTQSTCPADQLVYDDDAVNGTTVTVTPAPGTAGTAETCQVTGGYPGDNTSYGQAASCSVNVPPGTYDVSVPATISTPTSEVGIPFAYVSGSLSQSVTVTAGASPEVDYTTGYEPTIDVTLAGPLEPGCTASSCPAGNEIYDDDSVNGTIVTVVPVNGTTGSSQTCQVTGGVPGGTGAGQAASCLVGVAPGTYRVSVPARIAPVPDYGWGYVDVDDGGAQVVTVIAGAKNAAAFTTSYEAVQHVSSGPGSAHTSDGLLTAAGSGGRGTVTVGEYTSDPEGPATFNTYSASNDYFDVATSADSTFARVVFTVCGLKGNSDAVDWWSPASVDGGGQWQPVSPASSVSSRKAGCLTAALTASTDPSIADLTGTVFAIPLSLPAQRVSFASINPSPVAVGSRYRPAARSGSGLPVLFVAATTSGKGACSVSAGGTVSFTAPGTCTLQAEQVGSSRWAAASATQQIVVVAGRPIAVGVSYATGYRRALVVSAREGVLAKDTLNGATITSHTQPGHGRLTLRSDGAFSYDPRTTFSGADSFSYTIKNALGHATATVTIHVGAPPAAKSGLVKTKG